MQYHPIAIYEVPIMPYLQTFLFEEDFRLSTLNNLYSLA